MEDRVEGMETSRAFRGCSVSPTNTTSGFFLLGLCLAISPEKTVRWCTVSNHEASKCSSFMENMKTVLENGPFVSCVKKTSYLECIKAIWVSHCCLKESGIKSILSLLSFWNNFLLTGRRLVCGTVNPQCQKKHFRKENWSGYL